MGRIVRKALAIAGIIILVLLLIPVLAFGVAQTGPGKRWLASLASSALSSPGATATVSGISGLVPFDMRIREIVLADRGGPWLRLEDAAVRIVARDLLSGRLTFRRVALREVDYLRVAEGEGGSGTGSGSSGLPNLRLPIAVAVDDFKLDALVLAPPLVPAPLRFGLSGKGALIGGEARLDLAIARLGAAGSGVFHLELGGAPAQLHLSAQVEEPSGQLLSLLLGRSEPLPVSLDLKGDGPLSDWHGRLSARAGDAAEIDAVFALRGGHGYELRAQGGADIAGLLPADWRNLVGARDSIDLRLGFGEDHVVTLEALRLTAPAILIDASGTYGPDGAIAGKAALSAGDLAPLGRALDLSLTGRGEIEANVAGSLVAPMAALTLTLEQPALDQFAATRLSARLELKPETSSGTALALQGSGAIEGLSLPMGQLGQSLDWQLAGRFDRAQERLALSTLAIRAGDASLVAQGAGDLSSGVAGEARLRLPDLARLGFSGISGGLDLSADFRCTPAGAAVLVLSGETAGLALGDKRLTAGLGGKLRLAGTLRRDADGAIAVEDLTVTGKDMQLAVEGSDTADDRIAAKLHLSVPRLAAFDPSAKGRVTLDGTASGTLEAPKITATLAGDQLAFGRFRLDRLKAQLAIGDLRERAGQLNAEFHGQGLDGTLAAEGALGMDGAFTLSRLRLAAAGSTIEGSLSRRADRSYAGKLTVAIPDLRPWSALAGGPLGGRLTASATLGGRGGDTLDLNVSAAGLSYGAAPPARLERLTLEARLANLFKTPQGRVMVGLADGAVGAATVSRLRLTAQSVAAGHFAIAATLAGKAEQKLELAARGTLALRAAAGEFNLTELKGSIGILPLTLKRQLKLAWRGDDYSMADLALGLGGGSLSGSGRIAGGRLSLRLKGEGLALNELAPLAGHEDLAGSLGFELAASGSLARPQGKITLDGERLRLTGANSDLPPLGLVVSAELASDRLSFRGRLAGPKTSALGFSGAAPLVLRLSPFAADLPRTGALSLHLEGDAEVANFAELLPSEDRIAGLMHVDLTISGTPAEPLASGRITLSNGRYENLQAGAALTGLHLTLAGNRDRLVLEDFGATDGANGKVSGGGALVLVGSGGSDLSLNFTRFRVLGRDDATAAVSGKVALAGTLAALHIEGRLTVDEADLTIPKSVPASLRPVPVEVIDSASGQVLSKPAAAPGTGIVPAIALDIVVSMPGRVFVRGDGLDSEWRGRITVVGTSVAPQLGGQLQVVHGSYQLLGQTFRLTRGTVRFLGGGSIDPALNIEAQAQTSSILAIVNVGGTAMAPKISMASQPVLPQDEILSRVLFGTSASQISPAQGLQIAQAAASLAGGGGPDVLTRLRQGLGLDRLTFGSSSDSLLPGFGGATVGPTSPVLQAGAPPGVAGGSTVNAGKYLANGVYVGVSQGLTPGSSTVNAQIDVTKHISISSEAGQASGSGVGVNWRLDY